MTMEPYQQRVVDEKAELDEKIKKLKEFMVKPTFLTLPLHERNIMSRQLGAMDYYSECLAERVLFFNLNQQEKGL